MKLHWALLFALAVVNAKAATLAEQIAAITPGHWAAITADNTINDINPNIDPAANPNYPAVGYWNGGSGYAKHLQAWNSGVWAPDYGTCGAILYWGGGHTDYWGSDISALDLCGGAGGGIKWTRLNDPYGAAPYGFPLAGSGALPDGSPVPQHTYDTIVFDELRNRFVAMESMTDGYASLYSHHAWTFDMATGTWGTPVQHLGLKYGSATYDPVRHVIWAQANSNEFGDAAVKGQFFKYDPSDDSVTYYGGTTQVHIPVVDAMMSYDPVNNLLVLGSFRNTKPPYIGERDPTNPAADWKWTAGINAPSQAAQPGAGTWVWSPAREAWIAWGAISTDVWEVKRTGVVSGAGQYTWTNLTDAGNSVNPAPTGSDGIYGHFQLVTVGGVEALVGINKIDEGLYAFRLPGEAASCTDICSLPGVFVCDYFDGGVTTGTIYGGDTTPVIADGLAQFTIPNGSGANPGGEIRWSFLGAQIGQGDFMAFSYRIRGDAGIEQIQLSGRKEFTMWQGPSSCAAMELSQSHNGTLVTPNHHCGIGLYYALPAGNYQLQYPDYDCKYQNQNGPGCLHSVADRWDTYYVEITVGTYEQPDSHLVMWHKPDGGIWQRYIDKADWNIDGPVATPDLGWSRFMITPYQTGKNRAIAHNDAHVFYDWVIMATVPFKDYLP